MDVDGFGPCGCANSPLISAIYIFSGYQSTETDHAILKNLTFTAVPARSHDPVAARRAKLVERIEEQKALRADPAHVRKTTRWTGKGDKRRQVEREQRVRPWWRTDLSGAVVMAIYHGAKPLESRRARPASRRGPGQAARAARYADRGGQGRRARRADGRRADARHLEAPTRGLTATSRRGRRVKTADHVGST